MTTTEYVRESLQQIRFAPTEQERRSALYQLFVRLDNRLVRLARKLKLKMRVPELMTRELSSESTDKLVDYLTRVDRDEESLGNLTQLMALIACNMRCYLIDVIRRRAKSQTVTDAGTDDFSTDWWHNCAVTDPRQPRNTRPTDQELTELRLDFHDTFDHMKIEQPDLAILLEMKFYLGLTNHELAELHCVTDRTILNRLHSAIAIFADHYHGDELDEFF